MMADLSSRHWCRNHYHRLITACSDVDLVASWWGNRLHGIVCVCVCVYVCVSLDLPILLFGS